MVPMGWRLKDGVRPSSTGPDPWGRVGNQGVVVSEPLQPVGPGVVRSVPRLLLLSVCVVVVPVTGESLVDPYRPFLPPQVYSTHTIVAHDSSPRWVFPTIYLVSRAPCPD